MANVTPSITVNTTVADDETMALATKMHWVSSVIFGIIFMIIGLTGNSLSILVWRRKVMKSSTGTYLIAQAVADSGLLVFFFITDTIKMIWPEIANSYAYGSFFSYIGYPIFFLFVVCSIWLTVGVTVDRYIQVCWIMHAKTMCNDKRAYTGIGIITFLCFVINLPHFMTYKPVSDDMRSPDEAAFMQTDFGSGEGSMRYEFWVHCMFLVLVPWATIFILNMLIIRQVTRANKRMEEKRSSFASGKVKRSESQITRILLTVTFTFLVLIALQCITQCFFMLKDAAGNRRIINEAFSVAKLGIVINSSINFFLYCLTGRRFRKELGHIMFRHCACARNAYMRESSTGDSNNSSMDKSKSSMTSSSKF
ncbi:probable G-protein coupled receptor 139 [Mizuhopecten yessoensis]|uniref:FMRFamide receptor n=1 Tax=Mizuhopecten yessoensis TaxID=6573 RepID=A0A210QRI0_MIZYE|nr:probable G-protein coupled receptor 139 [Mizuhopecten yessoensis]OWF51342.1 FMRFamide receptor [Mizuhopecten yessoensis]